MVSINDPDFVENFDLSKMTVGSVGFGYVGKAVISFFEDDCSTLVYDKYQEGFDTLENVVRESHIIFACVPTPMEKDGSCHTGIVESVLNDIKTTAKNVGRDVSEFVVIIKSTVWPGFTEKMQAESGLRVLFSPEFLTEKNSIEDFETIERVILGGDEEDALVVGKFFERKIMLKNDGMIFQCGPTTAELCKLFTNAILATKVIFGNEMYLLCNELGVDYDEVKLLACLDYRRIANSHLDVPGPDGDLGYGGHCFSKDVNNLRHFCASVGLKEKLFSVILDRNDEIRTNRDWEEMEGRAVIGDYSKKSVSTDQKDYLVHADDKEKL